MPEAGASNGLMVRKEWLETYGFQFRIALMVESV
jgi:hypothetical protein